MEHRWQRPHIILGVDQEAKPKEVKMAYLKLVQRYHPDHDDSEGAQERFMRIQEAFDTMKDAANGVKSAVTISCPSCQ
jgi:molecular chaperone DnaJ